MGALGKFGVGVLLLISVQGCALIKSSSDAPAGSPVGVLGNSAEGLPLTVFSPSGPSGVPRAVAPALAHEAGTPVPAVVLKQVSEVSALDRSDIKSFSKISIHLAYAEVSLASGMNYRKGRLKIERLSGESNCKVRVQESDNGLELSEPGDSHDSLSAVAKVKSAIPLAAKCRFSIAVELKEAAEIHVELVRGTLRAETWDEPIHAKIEWGEIDVGTVGELSVVCGRCTLTGDGVDGQIHYNLETGNVGLTGLTGSVEGQTLGDTVLRWRKLPVDSNIKLTSHAGDVILFFPESVPLAIDLKAPHGEVNSRFQTGSHGVPVTVSAELGNVKVYRAAKEGMKE